MELGSGNSGPYTLKTTGSGEQQGVPGPGPTHSIAAGPPDLAGWPRHSALTSRVAQPTSEELPAGPVGRGWLPGPGGNDKITPANPSTPAPSRRHSTWRPTEQSKEGRKESHVQTPGLETLLLSTTTALGVRWGAWRVSAAPSAGFCSQPLDPS